jgi:hypothetical protein
MQQPSKAYLLDHAVGHMSNDTPILEIRSFFGRSINAREYLKGKHENTNRLISYDNWSWALETEQIAWAIRAQTICRPLLRPSPKRLRMFGRGERR